MDGHSALEAAWQHSVFYEGIDIAGIFWRQSATTEEAFDDNMRGQLLVISVLNSLVVHDTYT